MPDQPDREPARAVTNDRLTIVRSIASSLQVLHDDDRIAKLDSLTLVDFMVAIEEETGLQLLSTTYTDKDFVSVATVVALLNTMGKS